MSHEEQDTGNAALGLVKEFFAAKERHDLDATMALFSDSGVYGNSQMPADVRS